MKRIIILTTLAFCCLVTWFVWPSDQIQPSKKSDRKIISGSNQISTLPKTASRREQLKNLIETNDNRINFFGVVTDTEGNPLEEVQVSWEIVKSGSFAPSLGLPTGSRGTAKTDSNGRFAILNESGTTIGIESLKYLGHHNIDNAPRSFGYGNAEPHQPDISTPIRFVMIRDGGERSKKLHSFLKFEWDGLPKEIEIGGNGLANKIIFVPTRQPLKQGERVHEWTLMIKAQDGQLILGINDGISLAPKSGYVNEIILERDKNGQWGSEANALIYLKTDHGKYAEIRLSAYSDRGAESSATGDIEVRWNTDGGRAFE
jgi:hypothetical protein